MLKTYNITHQEITNLTPEQYNIIVSLASYFTKNKELSTKQEGLLFTFIKRIPELPEIKYKKCYLYREYYFRADSNGDYLQDTDFIISENKLQQEQITDLHAAQYNYSQTVNKYQLVREIDIPETVNLKQFSEYFEEFELLIKKFKKARTIKSKYNYLSIIKLILQNKTDKYEIKNILYPEYYK